MHHGATLKQYAKAKGFTNKRLAKEFGISTTAVEQHFKREKLTRNVLERYADKFGFSVDSFYADGPTLSQIAQPEREQKTLGTVMPPLPTEEHEDLVTALRYKDELLKAKDETIADLRRTVDTLNRMISFFPNAAQLALTVMA